MGCKSLNPSDGSPSSLSSATGTAAKGSTASEALWDKAISKSGKKNEQSVFSSDGRKIYFIASGRPRHRTRQLYELTLSTGVERRVTYQDGEVHEVATSTEEGSIYYTSTTDAIKESLSIFDPNTATSVWPPTDVYKIKSRRDPHERLSNSRGFDGFLHLHVDSAPMITASHLQNGDLQLVRRSVLGAESFETILQKKGFHLHSFTTLSRRRWRAWIEEDKSSGLGTLQISSKGGKPTEFPLWVADVRDVYLFEVEKSDLAKEAIAILYSAKSPKHKMRQFFWTRLKDNCTINVKPTAHPIANLSLSHDRSQMTWTMTIDDQSQIFVDNFKIPDGPCE